jgi:hypothetical protein
MDTLMRVLPGGASEGTVKLPVTTELPEPLNTSSPASSKSPSTL